MKNCSTIQQQMKWSDQNWIESVSNLSRVASNQNGAENLLWTSLLICWLHAIYLGIMVLDRIILTNVGHTFNKSNDIKVCGLSTVDLRTISNVIFVS